MPPSSFHDTAIRKKKKKAKLCSTILPYNRNFSCGLRLGHLGLCRFLPSAEADNHPRPPPELAEAPVPAVENAAPAEPEPGPEPGPEPDPEPDPLLCAEDFAMLDAAAFGEAALVHSEPDPEPAEAPVPAVENAPPAEPEPDPDPPIRRRMLKKRDWPCGTPTPLRNAWCTLPKGHLGPCFTSPSHLPSSRRI